MSNKPTLAAAPVETQFDDSTIIYLRALAKRFPSIASAVSEIAHLGAVLELPRGTVHVVSDVHGEFKKLKHIINNASGSLRPLVEQTFGDRLSESEKLELLNLIYYPRETYLHLAPSFGDHADRMAFLTRTIRRAFDLVRELMCRYSVKELDRVFPETYRQLFYELLLDPQCRRTTSYIEALLAPFVREGRELDLLRHTAHVVRNLAIYELIVAGDLGDRGPRIDRVIDYCMRQPRVAVTWGNHDVTWMASCLGHDASIATVLRISLRYRRLSQLEEGYGIPIAPLEKLARSVYGDDPAARFSCRGEGLRDALLMSRMQKAIAVIQFKLEGQAMFRNPEYGMEHRAMLHRIDPEAGAVEIDGVQYPLLDTNLPTVDWSDPYRLSAEEQSCMDRLRQSFLASSTLWNQMQFLARRGSTYARRDDNLIFHGCVPVDDAGNFLSMRLGGVDLAGKALFDEINRIVQRAFRERDQKDLDFLWYLWTGPLSPLFGKDRMATFETYFVAEKSTHKETKNPYFKLIHTQPFCRTVLADFGITSDRGLIVNGHVPVKIEQGESPLKDGGLAVTIDGAFSEAYGDKGFTLVIRAGRVFLAQHHHFESVEEAILQGADIIPTITEIRTFDAQHRVRESEAGPAIEQEIAVLELLITAYRENVLQESEAL